MANTTTIILKNSGSTGNIPTAANLQYGEIALNYADGILYYKNPSNEVLSISGSGSSNTANGAYEQANIARTHANSAFLQANLAFAQANVANSTAVSSFLQANLAFAQANTKLNISGGTITGDLTISGNLTLSGNTTFINVQTYQVTDPLIYLAANNYVSDLVDIGFVANYVNATGSNVHTGLMRDSGTKEYYLFEGYDKEPTNNHIDPNGNNFTISVLNANLKSSNIVLNGIVVDQWINSVFTKANGVAQNAFVTIVANGTSLVADSNADTLTIRTTGNVAITADSNGDNMTFDLTTTGVTAATYGSSTIVPVFTVDSRGRLISVTNTTIDTTIATAAFNKANAANVLACTAFDQANAAYSGAVLKTGNTMTGQLVMSSGISSTSQNTGSIVVNGGIGVSGNIFISNVSSYGFANSSNVSVAKIQYNHACNSIDFVFG